LLAQKKKEGNLEPTAQAVPLWPFVVYFFSVIALVGAIIGLSSILGERHFQRATGIPYESGIEPTGSARVRVSAQFYLIAMLFVIFDMETVFIVAWAVGLHDLGWFGYLAVLIFLAVLVAGLIYEWKMGVLDWGPRSVRERAQLRAAWTEKMEAPPAPAGED
jgi:NADH-quinone oxidoreductase subunit A